MAEIAIETDLYEPVEDPDISHIVTEDDEPVDNIFSEKQQRLLAETLNGSWNPGRPFVAFANVGIFYGLHLPPIVPDMFLSMDVQVAAEKIWEKRNRSYFIWEFGKPPEIVVEVVSNKKGGEAKDKIRKYEKIRVWYYVIYDPQHLIQKEELRVYELTSGGYIPKVGWHLPQLGLGIKIWDGVYEGMPARWLRWCDPDGNIIPTGKELAERAKAKADAAIEMAEIAEEKAEAAQQKIETAEEKAKTAEKIAQSERYRAEKAEKQAARLAEKLRMMGIDETELAGF